ncbi:MAG: hypothetical protein GF383_13700, partial [Candidatus Lokiarchaeota archaeon]|nr:hypothetical protein [Candidatus Lokiarchaeota archaeon]MBD3342309.1 hypothetical protein [Candidatus Lokiarchaeota archaeon]
MNSKDLLENPLFKNANRIKGKFPAFSERTKGKLRTLKVKNVYQLRDSFKNFFLIVLKNDADKKRERIYLCVSLASQSSDLMVILAKDFALDNSLH